MTSLASVFQVRSLSGRSIRQLTRIQPADPAMLTASSDSDIWITSLVDTSALNALNPTDGSIISWSTSRPPVARRRRNAVRTAATRAIANGT
ncbi:hypothetical protein P5V15_004086 [Pogonomyrmex californicus]